MINLVQFIEDSSVERKYISGVTRINDDEIYDNTLWYKISEEVYIFLKDNLTTPNGTKTNYFVDIDTVTIDNISDIKTDDNVNIIQDTLMNLITQYDKNMQEVLVSISHMYPFKLYQLFNYHNILVGNGIFVTDDNQEDMYIEVLNKGNEDVIVAYSEYIETKNDMNDELLIYKAYEKHHNKLFASSTKEEAKEIYEEFMKLYN